MKLEHLQQAMDTIAAALPQGATVSANTRHVVVTCSDNVFDVAQSVYAVTLIELAADPVFDLVADKFVIDAQID